MGIMKNIFSKDNNDVAEVSSTLDRGNEKYMNEDKVELELSIPDSMEARMSNVVREMHRGELESFAPINKGDINISTSYIYDDGEKIEASIYVRNGLENPIKFEVIPLIIVGKDNEVYARQSFSGSDLGEVPALSARPWKVYFFKESIVIDNFLADGARVAFDSEKLRARLNDPKDYEMFPSGMQDETRRQIIEHIGNLRVLNDDEVEITGYDIVVNKESLQIGVCLIVRNGRDRNIKIQEVPLILFDANGNECAKQKFIFEGFDVMSKSSRVLIVAFEYNSIININADLSSWKMGFFNE